MRADDPRLCRGEAVRPVRAVRGGEAIGAVERGVDSVVAAPAAVTDLLDRFAAVAVDH